MLSYHKVTLRMRELEHTFVPQSMSYTVPHRARLDILYWVTANGVLKSEHEILQKIERLKEEMLVLSESDLWYQEKSARIEELLRVLN